VIAMTVRESLIPVGAGLILGMAGAAVLTRFIATQLFGVTRDDPWTVAVASAVLLATAALAAFLPARRATRIEPTRALRYE
jgi:ABC-type antimicrobial peptide transport system permease subunit